MLTKQMEMQERYVDTTNVTLVEPTVDLALEFLAMVCEFRREKSTFFCEPIHDLQGYIQRATDYSLGRNLPADRVPCSEYWLVRDGWMVVGKSGLRHRLNESLSRRGGHVGYRIRPSERQKGYGRLILKLTLEKAWQMGLTRVLVTCDSDNMASARIIRKNGGVFQDEVSCKDTGKLLSRYWIESRLQK